MKKACNKSTDDDEWDGESAEQPLVSFTNPLRRGTCLGNNHPSVVAQVGATGCFMIAFTSK